MDLPEEIDTKHQTGILVDADPSKRNPTTPSKPSSSSRSSGLEMGERNQEEDGDEGNSDEEEVDESEGDYDEDEEEEEEEDEDEEEEEAEEYEPIQHRRPKTNLNLKNFLRRPHSKIEDPLSDPQVQQGLERAGLTSSQLVTMSVKDLNKRLTSCPSREILLLKRCRRTLKNRGYAKNCRIKRIAAKNTLERVNKKLLFENEQLREEISSLKKKLEAFHQLQQRRESSKSQVVERKFNLESFEQQQQHQYLQQRPITLIGGAQSTIGVSRTSQTTSLVHEEPSSFDSGSSQTIVYQPTQQDGRQNTALTSSTTSQIESQTPDIKSYNHYQRPGSFSEDQMSLMPTDELNYNFDDFATADTFSSFCSDLN